MVKVVSQSACPLGVRDGGERTYYGTYEEQEEEVETTEYVK
jgi:hypothetical protein